MNRPLITLEQLIALQKSKAKLIAALPVEDGGHNSYVSAAAVGFKIGATQKALAEINKIIDSHDLLAQTGDLS